MLRRKWLLIAVCFGLLMVVLAGGAGNWGSGTKAYRLSGIGFVDWQKLVEVYVPPVVRVDLIPEMEKLQSEFDQEAAELDSEEKKRERFTEYQKRLDDYKETLINQAMQEIAAAVREVGDKEGMDVILYKDHLLYGGVDLTEQVLALLHPQIEEANTILSEQVEAAEGEAQEAVGEEAESNSTQSGEQEAEETAVDKAPAGDSKEQGENTKE